MAKDDANAKEQPASSSWSWSTQNAWDAADVPSGETNNNKPPASSSCSWTTPADVANDDTKTNIEGNATTDRGGAVLLQLKLLILQGPGIMCSG